MKKKIFMFILSFCLIIPGLFLFSACDKNQTENVQVRVGEEYIEWSVDGENWSNVISIQDIKDILKNDENFKGEKGEDAQASQYTVTFDYGIAKDMFIISPNSVVVAANQWIQICQNLTQQKDRDFLDGLLKIQINKSKIMILLAEM